MITGRRAGATSAAYAPRPKGCKVGKAAGAQSVPHNTTTAVTWTSTAWDDSNFHDTATNNTRITIPAGMGGRYHFWTIIEWDGGVGTTQKIVQLLRNGALYTRVLQSTQSDHFSVMVQAEPGDYSEVTEFQASGAAVNIRTASEFGCSYEGAS
jgi:hypothetical protein